MLGLVSQSMGHRIGKGIHPVIDVHLAPTPSEVAGASSVASRMLIFYDHLVAHLKFWRNIYLHPLRNSGSTGLHFLGPYGLVAIYPGKSSLRIP